MDIESISLNSNLRLYYKAQDLRSGQDVVFNIWDNEGVQLHSVAADGEIGSRGIYYLDITTPNYNTHILVKGSLSDGSDAGLSVYTVGFPNQKLFYTHGALQIRQTIEYTIFDINAEIQDSGLLQNLSLIHI